MAFTRTQSADDSGFLYEIKMAALVALRLYNANSVNEFNIAGNMDAGGKFDDIVFSAKFGDQWQAWFIQLKHKRGKRKNISLTAAFSGSSKEKDFNLSQYFHSYTQTVCKFTPSQNVIFGKPGIIPCFVLFTNAPFHDEVYANTNFETVDIDLLQTNCQDEKNVRFDLYSNDLFCNSLRMNNNALDNLMYFSQQFCFCVGKAGEEGIDELVNAEIQKAKQIIDRDADIVMGKLYEFMRRQQRAEKFVTKDDVRHLLDKTVLHLKQGKKEEPDVEFTQAFLLDLNKKLVPGVPILLRSVGDKTLMCRAALKQLGLSERNSVSIKMIETDSFQYYFDIWGKESDLSLVVDCECDVMNVNEGEVISRLSKLAAINPKNKIILVISTANKLIEALSKELKKQAFNCSLKDLEKNSKLLLGEIEVMFQGYKTPLSLLLGETRVLDDVFDMTAMTNLLLGQQPQVGIKPLENIPYYVPRILTRRLLSVNVFKTLMEGNIFALSGITPDEVVQYFDLSPSLIGFSFSESDVEDPTKLVYIVTDPNNVQEFEKISSKKPNLHLLHQTKKALFSKHWSWKRSKGNIDSILEYLIDASDYFPTDDIMKIQEKVVVVCAEPGMGKSTLLDHMAAHTKSVAPHMWVVSVRLSDYVSHFVKPDFIENAKTSVKDLVAEAAGLGSATSKFDKRLFNYCYDVSGCMIILLDGFDEITPHYTEQGVKLIETLRDARIARVWVSTRPVWSTLLQTVSSTVSLTIQPFGPKDQEAFLEKYWGQKSKDPEKLQPFIKNALALISSSFDDDMNAFAGIPLQTRMIAEAFDPSEDLPAKLNGFELFQKFIDAKINVFFGEKTKTEVHSAHNLSELNDRRTIIEQRFMQFGLLTLLSRIECSSLNPAISKNAVKTLKDYVKSGNERVGIVLSFENESPVFIHRTFAEYFVAKFFTSHFETNEKFLKSESFLSAQFNFVRYFFNRMLAKEMCLHEAVLGNNLKAIAPSPGVKREIDSTDAGGRTALHVAAALGDGEEAIKLLLQSNADPNAVDEVMKWKPLDYALRFKHINNVGPLLDVTANPALDVADCIPITWETLKLAVEGDYLQLLLYLFEHGIGTQVGMHYLCSEAWIDGSDSDNLTLLHIVAWYNAHKIMKYLLRSDCRDCKLGQLEIRDSNGKTPLLMAALNGSVSAAKVLVENKASVLVEDNDGYNFPQIAVLREDEKMLKLALAAGKESRVNVDTYLCGAVTSVVTKKTNSGLEMLLHLIVHHPQVSATLNKKGVPLFASACIRGNPFVVTLLSDKADVNMVYNGATPLIHAVSGGHVEVVEALLQAHQIDLDACNENGCSALFLALSSGNADIVKQLINKGASVTTGVPTGTSIADLAVSTNNSELIELLIARGVNFSAYQDVVLALLTKNQPEKDSVKKPEAPTTSQPSTKVSKKAQKKKKSDEDSTELIGLLSNPDIPDDVKEQIKELFLKRQSKAQAAKKTEKKPKEKKKNKEKAPKVVQPKQNESVPPPVKAQQSKGLQEMQTNSVFGGPFASDMQKALLSEPPPNNSGSFQKGSTASPQTSHFQASQPPKNNCVPPNSNIQGNASFPFGGSGMQGNRPPPPHQGNASFPFGGGSGVQGNRPPPPHQGNASFPFGGNGAQGNRPTPPHQGNASFPVGGNGAQGNRPTPPHFSRNNQDNQGFNQPPSTGGAFTPRDNRSQPDTRNQGFPCQPFGGNSSFPAPVKPWRFSDGGLSAPQSRDLPPPPWSDNVIPHNIRRNNQGGAPFPQGHQNHPFQPRSGPPPPPLLPTPNNNVGNNANRKKSATGIPAQGPRPHIRPNNPGQQPKNAGPKNKQGFSFLPPSMSASQGNVRPQKPPPLMSKKAGQAAAAKGNQQNSPNPPQGRKQAKGNPPPANVNPATGPDPQTYFFKKHPHVKKKKEASGEQGKN